MRLCLDACVLYPTVLRDCLMGLAAAGIMQPCWSERILEEWARAAERNLGPEGELIALGEIALLRATHPDAMVPPDLALEAQLYLPDPADVHVLATAIAGGAEGVLTFNLRDFPRHEMTAHNLHALDPDRYLCDVWADHPDLVAGVCAGVLARMNELRAEVADMRMMLKRARLPKLAKRLAR
ncbi:PIN domain-containing protein [Rhodobacteraceae bacterium XHP0102]|nr:PIN domain-containing protein [Rhodobacteraceae bacterium XHP0102]